MSYAKRRQNANRKTELRIFNPRAEVESVPKVSAPRLRDLNGKKIAILGGGVAGGSFIPYLEEALKKRIPDVELRRWGVSFFEEAGSKEAKLKEVADNSDGAIVLLGISGGSTTRATGLAAAIERFGKPAVFILAKCFQANARFIARSEGLIDLALAPLPLDYVPSPEVIEEMKLGDKIADDVIKALTQWSPQLPNQANKAAEELEGFVGKI